MGENLVAILNNYIARSVFLLFCILQETESELRDIEIGVAGLIFTPKISMLYGKMIPIPHRMEEKYRENY